jgi:L-threonylcarbamoyladenylate synthase
MMVEQVALLSDNLHRVAEAFWPGPLTVILRAAESLTSAITAGTGTVGVRWPRAPFATRVMQALARPLTATSANRAGMATPVTADEVRSQLEDRLEVLVDGGTLPARSGSTVLNLTVEPPSFVREGPIQFEALQEVLNGRVARQIEKK